MKLRERTTMQKINLLIYATVIIGVITLWIYTIANYPQYEDSLIVAPLISMKSCINLLYGMMLQGIIIVIGVKTLVNFLMELKGCTDKSQAIVGILFHIILFAMLALVICLFIHINYGIEFSFISGIRE